MLIAKQPPEHFKNFNVLSNNVNCLKTKLKN